MSSAQIAVTLAGLGGITAIVWFFWLKKEEGMRAAMTQSGYQEATILVKDGYTPDTIVVERDKPVRLVFRREETTPCSETVVFSDFGKSAKLPQGEQVPVELAPAAPGEYGFSCQMGMYRGTLVVE
jgi:plastocyanin domain-containing protein